MSTSVERRTPQAPDVVRATVDARWVRHWRGWASWTITADVVWLAAFVVVLDVTSAWSGLSLGRLGLVPISPALPFAGLLAVRIGGSLLGSPRVDRDAWREYLVCASAFLGLVAVMYAIRVGTVGDAFGVVVGAFGEEVVYRVATVIVVGALSAHLLGREWRDPARWGLAPGLLGLAVAALSFSLLPGHVEQMTGSTTWVPFASLSLLLGYVVLRTGFIWPAVITHSMLNFITLVAFARHEPSGLRVVFAVASLGSLIVAADVAGRRLGRINRVPSVIDLEALDEKPVGLS